MESGAIYVLVFDSLVDVRYIYIFYEMMSGNMSNFYKMLRDELSLSVFFITLCREKSAGIVFAVNNGMNADEH